MTDPNSAPDLQSILDNLARYTSNSQSIEGDGNNLNTPEVSPAVATGQNGSKLGPDMLDRVANDAHLRPQSRSSAVSPKPIDPATITTWQDGLRCVTKIAAQNNQFAASIRRMIDVQKKNEMRWYAERQNLKQTQANRAKSSAQALSILQSLNKGYERAADVDGDAGDRELAEFDRKIHAAQAEVEASVTAELKALGVPFFGTDQNLVVKDEASIVEEAASRPKWSPTVTDAQLMELRKRMIQHLEDLYRD